MAFLRIKLCQYPGLRLREFGEGGAIGSVAAVTNAVNDALCRVGAEVCETPMTPRRILTAIQDAKSQRESVGT